MRDRLAAGDAGELYRLFARDGAFAERRTGDRRGCARTGADGAGAVRAAGALDADSLGRGWIGWVRRVTK